MSLVGTRHRPSAAETIGVVLSTLIGALGVYLLGFVLFDDSRIGSRDGVSLRLLLNCVALAVVPFLGAVAWLRGRPGLATAVAWILVPLSIVTWSGLYLVLAVAVINTVLWGIEARKRRDVPAR